jgi:ABC-type glycerol-3-phosphate transport system permease component
MAGVAFVYLAYLILPIALLVIGSFGETWTNTLLPSGLTGQWYREVAGDPSFQRAFSVSLRVVAATCVIDTLLALPLAYAIYRSASRGVQAMARLITLLPIAVPELVLAFGFILVFSSDELPWLGACPSSCSGACCGGEQVGAPAHAAALASLRMLWAVQIIAHSALTFARPRKLNCLNPLACLICPNTGSTTCFLRR